MTSEAASVGWIGGRVSSCDPPDDERQRNHDDPHGHHERDPQRCVRWQRSRQLARALLGSREIICARSSFPNDVGSEEDIEVLDRNRREIGARHGGVTRPGACPLERVNEIAVLRRSCPERELAICTSASQERLRSVPHESVSTPEENRTAWLPPRQTPERTSGRQDRRKLALLLGRQKLHHLFARFRQ